MADTDTEDGARTPTAGSTRGVSMRWDSSSGGWETETSTDGDFEPATDDGDSDEDGVAHEFLEALMEAEEGADGEEDDDDDDDDYEDAEDSSGLEIEFEEQDGDETAQADETITVRRSAAETQRTVMRLLASSQLHRLFNFGEQPRRRPQRDPNRFPKVPSVQGQALMASGKFGQNELAGVNSLTAKKRLARRILDREIGREDGGRKRMNQRLMAQDMIPADAADMIVHYDAPVYSGQFSDDGNFFYACVKDFKVRMYDTSNPYNWRYYKTVDYHHGQWTLTDATLSPDNRYLAYTSIQPEVCLAPTDPNDMGDPYVLDLADRGPHGRRTHGRHGSFGIWSIRYSGDGRELVAGTSANSIVVYDIESRQNVLEIRGHEEDVNAVCFGDKQSPHILYSGSDDTTLKVWDRRSMGDSREAGAFLGHTEGITYIDSKGDGRHILSNGKDQSMKLWDLRMAMSTSQLSTIDTRLYTNGFDYRWGTYDDNDWQPHPHDNSLVTFRGHKVLRTLIRCHFSPPASTNARYVYSGSEDGKVYIYNLDATLAGTVDVLSATRDSRPYDLSRMYHAYHGDDERMPRWKSCVRDASWHPNAPVIAASSWNGYGMSCGTVTSHSWNDGAAEDEALEVHWKMGRRVDDRLRADPALYGVRTSRRAE